MTDRLQEEWLSENQRHLMSALARLRATLERHTRQDAGEPSAAVEDSPSRPVDAASDLPGPLMLEKVCALFGLSGFERDLLLLCAGVELDNRIADLCAAAQNNPLRRHATFSLALAALTDAHWSAITPTGALRYWRLVHLEPEGNLTTSALRIDERVLHYLTGISFLDDRLHGLIEPAEKQVDLPHSHRTLAEQIARIWAKSKLLQRPQVIALRGEDRAAAAAVASAACDALGIDLHVLRADDIPASPQERSDLIRMWEREAALLESALLVDGGEAENEASKKSIASFLEGVRSPLIYAGQEPPAIRRRTMLLLDVNKPTRPEQQGLWAKALGEAGRTLDGQMERVTSQFNLSTARIAAAGAEALARASVDQGQLAAALWNACRRQARPQLDVLAQRIEPTAAFAELILPDEQLRTLREICAHVRQYVKVGEQWGFAAKMSRGLGITALFAGASGTGKTMAAEVLARELNLDLYRIDLSQVVNKYIGETEKNLRRVFDAADDGGTILLFDEADALFGKRSEVKDSHDRYANIEISYLLQRMESYRGLAILTTNMKGALDSAFMRRLRFVVEFPFPDAAQRARIWTGIFPDNAPTEKLDVGKLARLSVSGGNIRNIVLNAAFLAADAGVPVRMSHLREAACSEFTKMEKMITESEIRDWA